MAFKLLFDELDQVYGINQTTGNLRFFKDGTDGSYKLKISGGKPAITLIEDSIDQLAELQLSANGGLYLGENLRVGTTGSELSSFTNDGGKSLYVHNNYTDAGSGTGKVSILDLYSPQTRYIIQTDETGEFTGTSFSYTYLDTIYRLISRFYLKTGTTAASADVTISIYGGTTPADPLLFQKVYPASHFPASTEIHIDIPGYLEDKAGTSRHITITSSANFSIKTDVGVTFPWEAIDTFRVNVDLLLSIKEFEDGATYNKGDWIIDHDTRRIYACNITGIQTGTFASNLLKWDLLSTDEISKRFQTTGLLEGSVLTSPTTTTVSWTSGRGIVVNHNNPEKPSVSEVTWNSVTGYTPTYLGLDGTSIFAYNSSGSLVETLTSSLTIDDWKNLIIFGSATHISGQIVSFSAAPGNLAYDGINSYANFINLVIGPANVYGNVYEAASTNMTISVVGGQAYILASNFRTDPNEPDIPMLPSQPTVTFRKVYREGDPPGLTIKYDGSPTTNIDPTKYDDGSGTLQTTSSGYWTIQRIFRNRSGDTFVAYGQQEFSSKDLALEALGNEPFIEYDPLPFMLFRCSLVVNQAATNLSLTTDAEFFQQTAFRISGAQSGSATIAGITTPGGSPNNIQYNSSGTFGGNPKLSFNPTLSLLSLTESLQLTSTGPSGAPTLSLRNSSSVDKIFLSYLQATDSVTLYSDVPISMTSNGLFGINSLTGILLNATTNNTLQTSLGNTSPVLRLVQNGTNGGTATITVSSVHPEGVVPGNGGSLVLYESTTEGTAFVKRSGIPTSTTGWVDLASAAEAATLHWTASINKSPSLAVRAQTVTGNVWAELLGFVALLETTPGKLEPVNNRILVKAIDDATNGDLYYVSFSGSVTASTNSILSVRIYVTDGVSQVGGEDNTIEIDGVVCRGNNFAETFNLSGLLRGPKTLAGAEPGFLVQGRLNSSQTIYQRAMFLSAMRIK